MDAPHNTNVDVANQIDNQFLNTIDTILPTPYAEVLTGIQILSEPLKARSGIGFRFPMV